MNKTWVMFEDVPAPKDGACPNCDNKEFYEGPSGGMATNVKCAKCGLKWNVVIGTLFPWQYIGTAEDK